MGEAVPKNLALRASLTSPFVGRRAGVESVTVARRHAKNCRHFTPSSGPVPISGAQAFGAAESREVGEAMPKVLALRLFFVSVLVSGAQASGIKSIRGNYVQHCS